MKGAREPRASSEFSRLLVAVPFTSCAMKAAFFVLVSSAAISVQAQLPMTSPKNAGFDPVRLEALHATTKRFVDEGKHAGIVTLIARDGRIVDFQTYGLRDIEKDLPMERDTICRVYSMSKI